jgi:hypothetical protein
MLDSQRASSSIVAQVEKQDQQREDHDNKQYNKFHDHRLSLKVLGRINRIKKLFVNRCGRSIIKFYQFIRDSRWRENAQFGEQQRYIRRRCEIGSRRNNLNEQNREDESGTQILHKF